MPIQGGGISQIPPSSGVLWPIILLGVFLIGSGALYGVLRLLLKSPDGFVAVAKDGQFGTPRSIRGMASTKLWGWWYVTVGPSGNLRIAPRLGAGSASGGVGFAAGDPTTVHIPGMGSVTSAGPTAAPSRKSSPSPSSSKSKRILGKFFRDGDMTRFRNHFQGSTTAVTQDTINTVTVGDVQLSFCLSRDKFQGK